MRVSGWIKIVGPALTVLLWAGASQAVGAGLSTGADFLDVTPSARPDAMGQAFSAVADDINTLSFNPAGLGNIRLPEVSFSQYEFLAGISFNFAGAALPLGGYGTLGLGYLGLGTAPFNSTLSPSAVLGTDSESELMLGWGDGWGILQAGLTAKYIMRNVGTVSGTGVAADLGLRLRPDSRLSLGLALLNMGPDVSLTQQEALPTNLRLGAAYRLLELPQHSLDAAVDSVIPLVTSLQPRIGGGLEYWFQDAFALRVGYLANTDEEGLTAGAGVKFEGLELDYAYQPFDQLGSTSRFSGTYFFDEPFFAGGELTPPTLLTLTGDSQGGASANWKAPSGAVDHYALTLTTMDDGKSRVFDSISNPPVKFKRLKVGILYQASVVAVGKGGVRSMPSNKAFLKTSPEAGQAQTPTPEAQAGGAVRGQVYKVGLQISWEAAGFPVKGYRLYRKSPSGQTAQVTVNPKKSEPLWLVEALPWVGFEFTVTAVKEDETEQKVGSFVFSPGPTEIEMLKARPSVELRVTPEQEGRVVLEWDHAGAAGSLLLMADPVDRVFETAAKLNAGLPKNHLKGLKAGPHCFMVVNESGDGVWSARSPEVTAAIP